MAQKEHEKATFWVAVFIVIVCGFLPGSVLADSFVLSGLPTVQVTSSSDSTFSTILSTSKQQEYRVLIAKRGTDYIWVTRDNRRLIHTESGAFHLFTDPLGGGYVKVFDQTSLPGSFRDPRARFLYLEHMSMWLTTTTYWGVAETFNP